jgi:hypothetical protein
VVAHCDHLAKLKFSKALPCAFTEHGAKKKKPPRHPMNTGERRLFYQVARKTCAAP